MIVIDRIILLLILFGGVAFFWLSLRARRELHQLRKKKQELRETRCAGIEPNKIGLLDLLDETEKQELFTVESPLVEWLGGKHVSEIPYYDTLWYAEFARSKAGKHRLNSALLGVIGVLLVGRYFFPFFSEVNAHKESDPTQHLLPAMWDSLSWIGLAYFPLISGFTLITYGVIQKDKSDDWDFYTEILDDHAKELSDETT
ncbi:hypothetical protein P5V43_21395 [Mycobacteroides abscessus subsp. bolletii]|uniref:hypothetical protein n=1 Tax=Mycobacteroides abscessus TaxID=36809 RepID=UPI00266BFF34|nr:hypothetical protein [Mycobacteroides abscessus]MDO3129665.1 hypothetical protein [Mycobacteroides abscessus subsp. bolletii]